MRRKPFNDHNIEGDVVHIGIRDRICTIDLADLEMIKQYRWSLTTGGYATAWIDGKSIRMHRQLMGCPDSPVDHIDHNPLNNCRSNLRQCTTAQNCANRKMRKDNSSGFKGVNWGPSAQKWIARIVFNYEHIHLGCFDTPEEAHEAYKSKALELFGSFACNG